MVVEEYTKAKEIIKITITTETDLIKRIRIEE